MNRRGYTLVEVMMVVVVAAILFIAAMPDQSVAESQRGRNFATRIESDIAYAQNRSIADPTDPTVLRVDPVNNKYWLAKQSDTTAPIAHHRTGDSYVVETTNTRDFRGVDIVGVDFNGDDTLQFDGSGTIDQDVNALIQIKSGSTNYEVVVSHSTGRTTTKTALSKSIPQNTVAAATGSTREVGDDAKVRARRSDPTGEDAGADNGDDGGLLEAVGNLLNGLLGG